MPYVFISTQIRLECGPTVVGDEWSDKELMDFLGAQLVKSLGNNFLEYKSDDAPRIVLNKMENKGYRVVSSTGVGQTLVWTLYKPDTLPSTDIIVDASPVKTPSNSSTTDR